MMRRRSIENACHASCGVMANRFATNMICTELCSCVSVVKSSRRGDELHLCINTLMHMSIWKCCDLGGEMQRRKQASKI